MTDLTPRLIVANADGALAFYQSAFGAEILECYRDSTGTVVHAALRFESVLIALAEAAPGHGNHGPVGLGGSPVLLSLSVEDADALGQRMVDVGAEVLIPIEDRAYGKREGRLRDPFGHLWILSQTLEALSPEEIRRRTGSS